MKAKILEDYSNKTGYLVQYLSERNIVANGPTVRLGSSDNPVWLYTIECRPEDLSLIILKFSDVRVEKE